MQLTGVSGAVPGSPSNAVLTIRDTVNAPGQLMFATNSYSVSKGNTILNLTVQRVRGSSGIVSVNYATWSGMGPGAAIPDGNFASTNGILTLSDTVTSGTIPITILQTNLVQGPVTFSVFLSNPSAATLGQPTNTVITILEDNVALAFATNAITVNEKAGSVTLNVARLYVLTNMVTVNYSTVDGTAKSNVNYSAVSGTLTFAPGQSVRPIPVPILYDTNVTGDLAFTVALSSPSVPAQLTTPSVATVVVQDADAGLSFTNSATTVLRTAGNAFITVVCSNTNVEPMSVNFATADGTAVAGEDYTATSGTLVFANGVATNVFSVPIIANSVVGSRSFTVSLSNPTAPGQLVPPSTQTVTIVDGVAFFAFSDTTYSVQKTAGPAAITVLRTGLANSIATVNYQTAAGTAVPGVNYSNVSGTLTFSSGVTSQTFNVPIYNNVGVAQPDLTVLLQLMNPTGGRLVPPDAAVLTIHDNTGSYVIAAGSALVSESGAGAPDGIIESNETVTMLFAFRDAGGTNVNNLIATLLATNGVTPVGYTTTNYGPLVYLGHSVSRPFTFTARGTNAQLIVATFNLFDGVKSIGTGSFSYIVGLQTNTFSNPAGINIIDAIDDTHPSKASPYPSPISVSGLGGTVLKTTVTLSGLTHASPADIEVLLVAPNQKDTLLMASAGGSGGNAALNNATIKFDDASTNSLPQFNQITNVVNRPTQFLPITTFPP